MSKSRMEILINEQFYNPIFAVLSSYIADNYELLELASKLKSVEEPQAATLYDLEIKSITNINDLNDILTFDVITACDIEIEETIRRERECDSVHQWLRVQCSASFDGEISDFRVRRITVYDR